MNTAIVYYSMSGNTHQTAEKIARLTERQTELIALSERDAYLEGFKLGVKLATEIYTDK